MGPLAVALAEIVERPSERRTAPYGLARDLLVAGLSGSGLATRFRRWLGRGGRGYMFSVFPIQHDVRLADCPAYVDGVLLAVRRDPDGTRTILHAEDTGPLPELVLEGAALRAAIAEGANEIHMHLLAQSTSERAAIIADLLG